MIRGTLPIHALPPGADILIVDTGDVGEDLTRLVTVIGTALRQPGSSLIAALAAQLVTGCHLLEIVDDPGTLVPVAAG